MEWRRQACKALRDYPKAKKDDNRKIVEAVETALQMQRQYYNGDARIKMVDLIYWRQTHTMTGAALECHYSKETVLKWNNEILSAVYVGLLRWRAPE